MVTFSIKTWWNMLKSNLQITGYKKSPPFLVPHEVAAKTPCWETTLQNQFDHLRSKSKSWKSLWHLGCFRDLHTLWLCQQFAIDNDHLWWIYPFKMVVFPSVFCMLTRGYPLVNKQFDPENHLFLLVSLIFQPRFLAGSLLIYWVPSGKLT